MKSKSDKPKSDSKIMAISIIVIIILAVVAFGQNMESSGVVMWITEEDIHDSRRSLRIQQSELQKKLNNAALKQFHRDQFSKSSSKYWIIERDKEVEGNVQLIIGKVEKSSGMKLTALGSLSHETVQDGVLLYHLTISCETTMELLVKFIDGLNSATPKFYWKSCSIRPQKKRGSDGVRFQGTLSFVSIQSELLIKQLLVTEDKI